MTAPADLACDRTDQPVETCGVCTHPVAAHDLIARRYCAATQANAISRKCICRPLPAAVADPCAVLRTPDGLPA